MSLRIATGEFRNRELLLPPANITRPASSRVREAIVNILKHNAEIAFESFEGLTVLDAYAGSGAVGFEMLSNNVAHVTFCEINPKVTDILKSNIAKLKVEERASIKMYACQQLPSLTNPCDIVFVDPPYNKGELESALKHLVVSGWIGRDSRVVIEHSHKEDVLWPGGMHTVFKRAYGLPIIHVGRFIG